MTSPYLLAARRDAVYLKDFQNAGAGPYHEAWEQVADLPGQLVGSLAEGLALATSGRVAVYDNWVAVVQSPQVQTCQVVPSPGQYGVEQVSPGIS